MKAKTPQEPTFSHQENLPPLPVPELQASLQRYLKNVEPHLSTQEFQRVEEIVRDFGKDGGVGQQLQKMLVERGKEEKNWLEEWWEYAAYLSWRLPIAIAINMITGFGSFTEFDIAVPQARRAAEIIRYTCEYHELLIKEKIPPEYMAGRVMCMNMFHRIFSSCRVPGEEADNFQRYDSSTITHVLIICNNCYFKLQVCDEDRNLFTIGDLEELLQRIMRHSKYLKEHGTEGDNGSGCTGLGAFTGTDRTTWAQAREELCTFDPSNEPSFRDIQSSLFAVCLEDFTPPDRNVLIVETAGGNCGNRWFDKSLQYMVFQNGMVGANMEHGNSDATIFMSMYRWLGQRYLERAGGIDTYIESRTNKYHVPPEPIRFHLPPSFPQKIESISREFQERAQDLSPCVIHFKDFGRTWIKKQKIPADSFVQMAIQLAYYSIFHKSCSTYESAHTRFFYHGRTETIRPCSAESMEFVKIMSSATATVAEKMEKFRLAIESHMEQAIACLNGNGCDRHLLGLQILAIQSGIEMPALFTDISYTKSGGGGHFELSTSNVSGYQWLWGGFSPMVKDGLGVCYDIDYEFIGFLITTNISGRKITSERFADALFQSCRQIKELVLAFKTESPQSKI